MRSRSGFTLLEVLVGLTISSAIVLSVHATFGGAMDTAVRLDERRRVVTSEVSGRTWLIRACAGTDLSVPGSTGFAGGPRDVRFAGRMRDSTGTLRALSIRLYVADGWLVAETRAQGEGRSTRRLMSAEDVTFDYLLEGGADARWVDAWHSPISAPAAIRVRLARGLDAVNTLLLAVGTPGG